MSKNHEISQASGNEGRLAPKSDEFLKYLSVDPSVVARLSLAAQAYDALTKEKTIKSERDYDMRAAKVVEGMTNLAIAQILQLNPGVSDKAVELAESRGGFFIPGSPEYLESQASMVFPWEGRRNCGQSQGESLV